MEIVYVTYSKEASGINDYIDEFLLKKFRGKRLYLVENFFEILKQKNKIIHIHFDYKIFLIPYFFSLLFLLKLYRRKIVITMHSYVPYTLANESFETYFGKEFPYNILRILGLIKPSLYIFNKLLYEFPDEIIFHSQCISKLHNIKEKIKIIHHPIHSSKKFTKKNSKIENILFLGQIFRHKGFDIFVNIAKRMPDKKFIVIFSYIDNNSNKDRIALNEAKKLNNFKIKKNISKNNLQKLLQKTDLVIFPFLNALGFSNALSKAISHRKTILASDVGIFRNLNFIFKSKINANDFIDKIKDIEKIGKSSQLRKQNMKLMEMYSKKNNLEDFWMFHEKIYEKLIGSK